MEDVLPYHDAMLKSESNKINGSEFRPEPELEPVASDTESVTSGSSSGDGIRRSRGIVVPPRFWQEHNNRLRRQTETPSSRNGVIANKGTLSTAHSPRLLVQKKSVLDSAVSSPRGVVNSRVLQGSPIRSAVRPASPSKLATPSVWSPSRGVSPSRAHNGVAGCMSSRFGSEPSVLSFAVDVSRGKVGENRIADAHLLRLFHNRLLQWRFVNARADAALSAQTFNAEVFFFLFQRFSLLKLNCAGLDLPACSLLFEAVLSEDCGLIISFLTFYVSSILAYDHEHPCHQGFKLPVVVCYILDVEGNSR